MGITAAAAVVAVKATVDIMATTDIMDMDISTAMRCQLQLLPQPLPQLQPQQQQLQAEECLLLPMFKLVSSSLVKLCYIQQLQLQKQNTIAIPTTTKPDKFVIVYKI